MVSFQGRFQSGSATENEIIEQQIIAVQEFADI
jgi:hypothetical protein